MSMSKRPALLRGPNEEDVLRALVGDRLARRRTEQQKRRVKKRMREINEFDRLNDR